MFKLFTHIDTFRASIKLDSDANLMTSQRVISALEKAIATDAIPLEETSSPYRKLALSTDSLNQKLKTLLLAPNDALADLIVMLSPFDCSFSNFDERTWVLLRVVCEKNIKNQAAIASCVYPWLLNNSGHAQAMQARLFLLSQDCFNMNAAGYEVIAEPILHSDDHWALLALLASPSFDLQRYKDDPELIKKISAVVKTQPDNPYIEINDEEAKSDLWAFVRYSGIGSQEKGTLLENIVTLLDKNISPQDLQSQDIITLIKISSKSHQLSLIVVNFLSELTPTLIQNWSFDVTPEEEASFLKPERKFLQLIESIRTFKDQETSEKPIEKIIFDSFKDQWMTLRNIGVHMINAQMDPWIPDENNENQKRILGEIKQVWQLIETNQENVLEKLYRSGVAKSIQGKKNKKAEDIVRQLLAFIATPEMFDRLVVLDENKKIQEKINAALNTTHAVFFSALFCGLWDRSSQTRACNETALEWLFNLDAFKELRFLGHPDYPRYLEAIFESHDQYFITKLFELERNLRGTPLFSAITKMHFNPNGSDVGRIMIAKNAILNPDFDISRHYSSASDGFKELPASKTAYALYIILCSTELNEIASLSKIVPNTEVLFHELTHRYNAMLTALVAGSHEAQDERFIMLADVKITTIFKLIKKTSPNEQKEFYGNNKFIDFLLSYRILTMRKDCEQATIKAKKIEKIKFLEVIRTILKSDFECAGLSMTQIAYIACHEERIKTQFDSLYTVNTEREITATKLLLSLELKNYRPTQDSVNKWLTDNIITQHSNGTMSKTEQTLRLLPDDMFERIFATSAIRVRNSADLDQVSHSDSNASLGGGSRVSESGMFVTPEKETTPQSHQKRLSIFSWGAKG